MTDVATLSVVVATSSVSEAVVEVDNLSGAVKRAQGTVAGLTSMSQSAAGAASAAASAYEKQGVAAARASTQVQVYLSALTQSSNRISASKQMEGYTDAMEENKKGASEASKQAEELASKFAEVAKAAAGGDGALQIALEKGREITAILGSQGAGGVLQMIARAFASLASPILSLISPANLLVSAIVGLSAMGIQLVDWSKLTADAFKALENSLNELSSYGATALASFLSGLKTIPSQVVSALNDIAGIIRTLAPIISSAMSAAANNLKSLLPAAASMADGLAGVLGQIAPSIATALEAVAGYLEGAVPRVLSKFGSLQENLASIAPYAVVAAGGLALVYAPAMIGGLAAVAGSIATVAVAAWGMAGALLATIGLPALIVVGLVALAGVVNIFRDEITQLFGRDIVGNAKDAVNYVIAAFVGGFNGIKASWSLLPSAMGDIIYSSANLVLQGTLSMVNKVIKMISDFIANAYNGLSDLASKLQIDLGKFGGLGEIKVDPINNPYAGSFKKTADSIKAEVEKAKKGDYIAAFAQGAGQLASGTIDKMKEYLKSTKDPEPKKKPLGTAGAPNASNGYDDIVADANKRIASLKQEQAALGMTEQAAAKMRYETDLLNKAQEKNIALTPEQKTELGGLAAEMASVEAATKSAREAMDFAKDLTKGFISDLKSGLKNGESFWKSFSTAAVNALNKIADKLLNDVLDSLLKVNSAASGGGGIGGFFSSLFGLGGGGGFNIGSNATVPTSGFDPFSALSAGWADGGYTGSGGVYEPAGIVHAGEVVWSQKDIARAGGVGVVEAMRLGRRGYADGGVVGEGGPQLVRAQPDAAVPVRRLRADNQNDASGSASGVHVTVGVSVDEDGNLKAYVKNVAQSEAQSSTRQGLNDFNQQLPDRVAQINRNPRRR